MIMISDINRLRLGVKIIQDGEPCVIIGSDFVKPGKGQVFNRVRFRKLITGKVLEKTFKSGDTIELADIEELNLMYLYHDSIYWYFMNSISFEQVYVGYEVVKDNIKWLMEQLEYRIIFWNKNPILVVPPHFIELKVISIQPSLRGDTVSPVTKLAVLSTGVEIKVPPFIRRGEVVRVNTRSSEYVCRVINREVNVVL